MTKLKLVSAAALAAAAMLVGSASPAAAWLHPGSTTQYPAAGGEWEYGFWNAMVRSYYYHPSTCHGSTVEFYNGSSWGTQRSQDTAAGYTSAATMGAYNLWYTDDRYWYRTTCG